jgi:hypothetical protein
VFRLKLATALTILCLCGIGIEGAAGVQTSERYEARAEVAYFVTKVVE